VATTPHPRRDLSAMPRSRSFNAQIDESLFGNPNAATYKAMRRRPEELKSLAVVSSNEMSNISFRATASLAPIGDTSERERLKGLSDSRKAKWPNTLEAARAKKERARQEKAEADEVMHQAIDGEEEALGAEKRRLAIERANKMLYDQVGAERTQKCLSSAIPPATPLSEPPHGRGRVRGVLLPAATRTHAPQKASLTQQGLCPTSLPQTGFCPTQIPRCFPLVCSLFLFQTDRVKALHSKLLLCDVLAERERQVALKKTIGQRGELWPLPDIRSRRGWSARINHPFLPPAHLHCPP